MIARWDRVIVTDPADEHHGAEGVAVTDPYLGPLTGRRMVNVRLDGQEDWNYDGFYVDQLAGEHDRDRYREALGITA